MDAPAWPPAWTQSAPLGEEMTLGVADGVELRSAESADGRVLMALVWPEGRRWIRVDPAGEREPEALRAGQRAEDAQLARQIDALWSQALRVAMMLMNGEVEQLAELVDAAGEQEPRRRFWRRN